MTKKRIKILLVEDNPGDSDLITEVLLEDVQNECLITNVEDGEQAINYLLKRGEYKSAQTPNLIILDLNLPKIDGRQVLKEIKSNENLKFIPIIIMTSSNNEKDITYSYKFGANSYITKKLDFSLFKEDIKSIADFWLSKVELPLSEDIN